jgi:hypothetical protein
LEASPLLVTRSSQTTSGISQSTTPSKRKDAL